MKIKSFCLALLVVLPGFVLAQKGSIESYRPEKMPVVDGDMSDWEIDWLNDPKGKFSYNIANDDENLYYRIKIVDETTQHKVGWFGLYVYLNPTGKKPGKLGIKFPMGKTEDEMKEQKPPDGPITEAFLIQFNKDLLKDAEALEILGLSKEPIVSSRLGLMNGIQVVMIADAAGDYYYEGKIPFKAFKLKKSAIKNLGVSIQTGKLAHKNVVGTQGPPAPNGGYGRSPYGSSSPYGYGRQTQGGNMSTYTPYNQFQIPTMMNLSVVLR